MTRPLVFIVAALTIASSVRGQATTRTVAFDTVTVDAATEATIESSLKWLASRQLANGSFSANQHQAAITAYATLAFLATGSSPGEGPYAKVVQRAQSFLVECCRADGFIAAPSGDGGNMYGHGIACVALGELYGQSRDAAVRPALQRAVQLIINCQNKEGGWRYRPVQADADLSVTVLQIVALRVAKNAGLSVPQETIDRAVKYVKSCHDKPTGGFYYQPAQPQPGFARTAAAIYSLQVCGLYNDPMVGPGAKYLFENRGEEGNWFTYGHFYAAPAMYMIGGDSWQKWYAYIAPLLLKQAVRLGAMTHWAASPQAPEEWTTAVNVTILAMPYHYLPLYQR